jgi:hypothetical protein
MAFWRLRGPASGGGGSDTVQATVQTNGRQLLSATTAVATALAAIPSGNTVTVNATGCDVPAVYAPVFTPGENLLGPGASWNGTIETGYASWTDENGVSRSAVPAADTRVDGKPIAQFLTLIRQRFVDDIVLSVGAIAKGGVAKVVFYAEGGFVEVTEQTIYHYTDVNGLPKWIDGWHCTLDYSAFAPQFTGLGQINVFARIYATDGSFETQLLGAANSTDTSEQKNVSRSVLRFYPAEAMHDYRFDIDKDQVATITVHGAAWPGTYATFKTIEDAMLYAAGPGAAYAVGGQQIPAPGSGCPEFVILKSGDYYPANKTTSSVEAFWASGWPVLRCDTGVTATIGRASYDASTTTIASQTFYGYEWRPMYTGVKYTGSGLTFDYAYLEDFHNTKASASVPLRCFDGINVISSRDRWTYLWWNRKISFAITPHYVKDCVLECTGTGNWTGLFLNNVMSKSAADLFTGCLGVFGNRVSNYGNSPNHNTYIGGITGSRAAGPSSARMVKVGAQGATTGTLELWDDGGSAVQILTLANYASLTDLCAAVTATGWTLSVHGSVTPGDYITDRHPIYLEGSTGGQTYTVTPGGAGVTINTQGGFHQDLSQTFGGVTNRLVQNTTGLSWGEVQTWFLDGAATDFGYVNCAIENDPGTTLAQVGGTVTHKHAVFLSCADPESNLYFANGSPSNTWSMDANCLFSACIFASGQWQTPSAGQRSAAGPTLKNMHYVNSGPSVTGGGTQTVTGSTSTGGSLVTMYPNYASGDWTPDTAALTDLVAHDYPYDLLGATRQALEPKGPVAARMTTRDITQEQALTLAVYPQAAAAGSLGDVVLTYKNGAGDTGATQTLTIQVAAA